MPTTPATTRPEAPPGLPAGGSPDAWTADDFAQVPDEELAGLARPQVLESAAYFELWRRYHGLVAEIVRKRLHGQDAEHTVTAFFCHKLPHVLDKFTPQPGRATFEAWLRRVLTNYLHDEWRRGRTRRAREVQFGADLSEVAERSGEMAVPAAAEHRSEHDHLVFFLRQIMEAVLEPVDRYIYRARYWEDRSMREIAEALGMTEANVRIRHWRAKQRLHSACKAYRDAGLL